MLGIVRVIVEKIGQSVVQVNGVRQEEGFQIALHYRHGLHPVVGGNFDQLGRSGKTDTHSCTNSVGGSNMVEEESRHERTVLFFSLESGSILLFASNSGSHEPTQEQTSGHAIT